MDILLDNKATKQKLLESKEEYGKLLKEQLQQKEKWEKEKETIESLLQRQKGMTELVFLLQTTHLLGRRIQTNSREAPRRRQESFKDPQSKWKACKAKFSA